MDKIYILPRIPLLSERENMEEKESLAMVYVRIWTEKIKHLEQVNDPFDLIWLMPNELKLLYTTYDHFEFSPAFGEERYRFYFKDPQNNCEEIVVDIDIEDGRPYPSDPYYA